MTQEALGQQDVADASDEGLEREILAKAARSAAQLREWDRAVERFSRYLEAYPDDTGVREEFAWVLSRAGRWEKSASQFETLIAASPRDPRLLFNLADIYSAAGRFEDAAQQMKRILEFAPDHVIAQRRLADVYSWQGNFHQAVSFYRDLLKKKPEDDQTRRHLLDILLWSGRNDELIAEAHGYLARHPDDMDVRAMVVDAYFSQRRFNEAERELGELLEAYPERAALHIKKVDLLLAQDKLKEALAYCDDASNRFPNNSELLIRSALSYGYLGQFHGAMARINKVLKKNPSLRTAQLARAELVLLGQRYYEAEEIFEDLERRYPDVLRVRVAHAESYYYLGEHRRAVEGYRAVLKRNPGDNYVRRRMVEALRELKKLEEAVNECRTILEKDSGNLPTMLLLADTLRELGRNSEAQKVYREIAQAFPKGADLKLGPRWRFLPWYSDLLVAEIYENILKINPRDYDGLKGYARGLVWKRDFAKAGEIYSRLLGESSDDVALLLDAADYVRAKSVEEEEPGTEEAMVYLDRVIELRPDNRETLLRLGSLLRGFHQYEKALTVFLRLIADMPDDHTAVVGAADAYRRLDLLYKANQVLSRFLAMEEDNLASRLAVAETFAQLGRGVVDDNYRAAMEIIRDTLEENPENLDVRNTYAHLLATHDEVEAAAEQYYYILSKWPDSAGPLLWLARVYSWNKEYDPAIETYDRLLIQRPLEHDASVERARVFGWDMRYKEALEAYDDAKEVALRQEGPYADVVVEPSRRESADVRYFLEFSSHHEREPEKIVRYAREQDISENYLLTDLEKRAKRANWNLRDERARRMYRELTKLRPTDAEVLFDLAQVNSRLGFSPRAESIYERLLREAPGHRLAEDALKFERLSQRPYLRFDYSYEDIEGFDKSFSIASQNYSTTALSSEFWDMTRAGVKYTRRRFEFDSSPSSDADRFMWFGTKKYDSGLGLSGFYALTEYSETDRTTDNYGVAASQKFDDFVTVSAFYDREDVVQNFRTISSRIARNRVGGGLDFDVTKRFKLGSSIYSARYSDNNDALFGNSYLSYEILLYPTVLKATISSDIQDFQHQDRVYFSPHEFWNNSLTLHWRHYLNDEHYRGADQLYYGLKSTVAVDSGQEWYWGAGAEALWDINKRWQAGVEGDIISADEYEALQVLLHLRYIF